MIPSNNLRPCVAAIAELVRAYNATAVLCTATQPAIDEMLLEYSKKKALLNYVPMLTACSKSFAGQALKRKEG